MRTLLLAGVLTLWALTVDAAEPRRGLTIDDLLGSSEIGMTYLTPDGRHVIYEWMPRYTSAPNQSVDVFQRVKFQLFKKDLSKAGPGEPLFQQAPGTGYWIASVSPDGKRLAVYSASKGLIRAGIYSLASGTVEWLPLTPEYTFYLQEPTWVSNTKIVFNVLPPEETPSGLTNVAVVKKLNKYWERTFSGSVASVTVIKSAASELASGPDEAGPQPQSSRRLVMADTVTDQLVELDQGGGLYLNVLPSPDGRYIAALKEGTAKVKSLGIPISDDLQRQYTLHIYSVDQRTSSVQVCERCDVVPGSVKWAANSGRLSFISQSSATAGSADVMQYDVGARTTGSLNIAGLALACGTASVIPVGEKGDVAVLARQKKPGESQVWEMYCDRSARMDWYVVGGTESPTSLTSKFESVGSTPFLDSAGNLAVLADGDVWEVWKSGKGRVHVRRTSGLSASAASWASASGQSPLIPAPNVRMDWARNGYRYAPTDNVLLESSDALLVYNLKSSASWQLRSPNGECGLTAVSLRTRSALYRCDEYPHGSTFVLVRDDRAPEQVFELNTWTRRIWPAKVVQVHYQLGEHHLSSCALVPPGHSPGALAPTIVYAYPNSSGVCGNYGFGRLDFTNMQLLAARGYVVLFAANPERVTDGELSAYVLAAVEAARAAGLTDVDRVGVYGHSFGYSRALKLLTETNKIKAGIVFNGASDHISNYGSMPLITRVLPDFTLLSGHAMAYEGERLPNSMGGPPWVKIERYVKDSPVLHANQINSPVMIVHSDMDRFDIGQSAEIFSALSRLGRRAEMITYWGEGHNLNSPANIRDFWMRVVDWYDDHLGVVRNEAGRIVVN